MKDQNELKNDLLKVVNGEGSHSCIFFCSLGDGAIEACLSSVVPADQKVMLLINGPEGEKLQKICDAYGLGQLKYIAPEGKNFDLPSIDYVLDLHKEEISHIAFVHCEKSLGIINPLKELGALASKYNKELIVNASTSFMNKNINVADENVHYITAALGEGISFVIAKKESLKKMEKIKSRNFYFDLLGNFLNPQRMPEILLRGLNAKVKGINNERFE